MKLSRGLIKDVSVLFPANCENNIVTVSSLRQGGREGGKNTQTRTRTHTKKNWDFTVSLPSCLEKKHVKNNQCSGIFGPFDLCASPPPATANVTCEISAASAVRPPACPVPPASHPTDGQRILPPLPPLAVRSAILFMRNKTPAVIAH